MFETCSGGGTQWPPKTPNVKTIADRQRHDPCLTEDSRQEICCLLESDWKLQTDTSLRSSVTKFVIGWILGKRLKLTAVNPQVISGICFP